MSDDQVFNNPSQSGLWIAWWKVSQEGIYMYYLILFQCRVIQTKKQVENILVLNAIIPKACKNDQEKGRAKLLKNYHWLLIRFHFWTLWISILKYLLALSLQLQLTKLYIFDMQFDPADCELFETPFLFLFWKCDLDKLGHCFLHLQGHLKTIKIYNCC